MYRMFVLDFFSTERSVCDSRSYCNAKMAGGSTWLGDVHYEWRACGEDSFSFALSYVVLCFLYLMTAGWMINRLCFGIK